MIPSHDSNAWNAFLELLQKKIGKEIDHDSLRMEVEEIYNFRLDHTSVSPEHLEVIKELFDRVVRYSPLVEDRAAYPRTYVDEQAVENAVAEARRRLGILSMDT